MIKRYAGGRLYDADGLAYTTADALRAQPEGYVVVDAMTGEDVTAAVLEGGPPLS